MARLRAERVNAGLCAKCDGYKLPRFVNCVQCREKMLGANCARKGIRPLTEIRLNPIGVF